MNTPVSFEIAKLLKEKGFKPIKLFGYISKFYNPNTKTLLAYGRTGRTDLSKAYFAPTIAEVVMWLYEKHGLWIEISLNQFSKPNNLQWMYSIVFTEDCTYSHSPKAYSSPTEAYSEAIEYTLKNLI